MPKWLEPIVPLLDGVLVGLSFLLLYRAIGATLRWRAAGRQRREEAGKRLAEIEAVLRNRPVQVSCLLDPLFGAEVVRELCELEAAAMYDPGLVVAGGVFISLVEMGTYRLTIKETMPGDSTHVLLRFTRLVEDGVVIADDIPCPACPPAIALALYHFILAEPGVREAAGGEK